jgi:hypothetical protein
MKFLLSLFFSNLSLPSCPTLNDIFIFSLESYLVKLITGFSLANPAWYLFQITDLEEEILGMGRRLSKCQL